LNGLRGDALLVNHEALGGLAGFVAGGFVAPEEDRYSTLGIGDLVLGKIATADHAQFLYDRRTGILSFDADGTGDNAHPVQITVIGTTSHPAALNATDIVVEG
jgi:hypothetical protein